MLIILLLSTIALAGWLAVTSTARARRGGARDGTTDFSRAMDAISRPRPGRPPPGRRARARRRDAR